MRKLLSANFSRLWKNKVFWLGAAGMLTVSVITMCSGCRQAALRDHPKVCVNLDEGVE